jgi:hypothetical protein
MKKFIIILLITFGIALLPTIFINFDTDSLVKPLLFPPKILFPIVWTILYFLMSISLYLSSKYNKTLNKVYGIQLILNSLWSPLFFMFKTYLFSTIELLILIIFVAIMIEEMKLENKLSAYLQIPYFIWLLFALYLNVSIYILN